MMKHYKILITILTFLLASVSCDIGDYDEAVRKGNDFVDKLLNDIVVEHGSEYDPYHLEDKVVGFSRKVLWVNVTGEASFHSGFIRGLTSLNRADGCHLREEGDRLIIKADLGAGVLDMRYSGTVKLMNFGPTITAHGRMDYVEVTLIMSCDSESGRDGKLMEFYIDDIKGENIWITGLGPLNYIASTMVSIVKKLFNGFIHRLIEKQIQSYISDRIPNYEFPVEKKTTVPSTEATEDDDISTEPSSLFFNNARL